MNATASARPRSMKMTRREPEEAEEVEDEEELEEVEEVDAANFSP